MYILDQLRPNNMNMHAGKSVIYNKNSYVYIRYFVASWACEITEILTQEALEKPLLCEDYSDLTSPNSNKIPDIHITVFVVYDTFSCMHVHIVWSKF